jgi:hypothetical protein
MFRVTYQPMTPCAPPHVEDVQVVERTWLKCKTADVRVAAGMVPHWRGRIEQCFDGQLCWRPSGAGFAKRLHVPGCSTGFWRPSNSLHRDQFGRYWADGTAWNKSVPKRSLPYVGVAEAPSVIPANTLVRLSLSRWYKPPESPEEGCWLQLSGVFQKL